MGLRRPLWLIALSVLVLPVLVPGRGWSAGADPAPIPFRFKGDVISIGVPGQGMLLALKDLNVAVHGLGPIWFWDLKGWELPLVGDTVVVEGYTISFMDRSWHVAVSIHLRNQSVRLRDPATGLPLWHDQGPFAALPTGSRGESHDRDSGKESDPVRPQKP